MVQCGYVEIAQKNKNKKEKVCSVEKMYELKYRRFMSKEEYER